MSSKNKYRGCTSKTVFIFALTQTSEATHDWRELKTNQKSQGWEESG